VNERDETRVSRRGRAGLRVSLSWEQGRIVDKCGLIGGKWYVLVHFEDCSRPIEKGI